MSVTFPTDEDISPSFLKLQSSLTPYIKQRRDTAHIRRLLSVHLESFVQNDLGKARDSSQPFVLPDVESCVITPPTYVRGSRREYLKCLRNHAKAQKEYSRVASEVQVINVQTAKVLDNSGGTSSTVAEVSDDASTLNSYTALLAIRQKLEKLQILQDYLERLSKSPSSSSDYLQPKSILKSLDPLPQLPADIVTNGDVEVMGASRTELKDLVNSLEKSVLRAKLQLGSERKLLAQLRASSSDSSGMEDASEDGNSRLSALNHTRDGLIGWVEEELSKTNDESSASSGAMVSTQSYSSAAETLPQIQSRYSQYTTARQNLIDAVSSGPDVSEFVIKKPDVEAPQTTASQPSSAANHQVLPYLKDLLVISNDQKGLIQQRSHSTGTLTKGKQEISYAMDRLAKESHLLPAYPLPDARKRRGVENTNSFDEEISSAEKPDPTRMARTWIYAAETAGTSTKEVLIEKVEEGGAAVEESRQALANLHQLMGRSEGDSGAILDGETSQIGERGVNSLNVWRTLDGELGVIRRDSL